MNWRFKILFTLFLFLPVFINSLASAANVREGNSPYTISATSNGIRVYESSQQNGTNVLHKPKAAEKQINCTSDCDKSIVDSNRSAPILINTRATKIHKNNTKSQSSEAERSFLAKETNRRARKSHTYQWKKEPFTGRGKEMELLLPLVIGFKLTSIISSGFTAIKIFLLQSMFIAKLAVIASAVLLLKSFYDFHKHKPMPHKMAVLSPYYDYTVPYHSGHDTLGYQLAYDGSGQWHGVAADTDIGTAKDDLETQYSNAQSVVADTSNVTTNGYNRHYYSQRDYTATERLSNSSTREKYKPLVIGYETYIKRITTEKRNDD